MIGSIVRVIVDRPLGSSHPSFPDMCYPINYGFVEDTLAPDGEEQDAYILGINEPVEQFVGVVIAIVRRINDVEQKWVVAPKGSIYSKEEVARTIAFQEQYFQTEIVM